MSFLLLNLSFVSPQVVNLSGSKKSFSSLRIFFLVVPHYGKEREVLDCIS